MQKSKRSVTTPQPLTSLIKIEQVAVQIYTVYSRLQTRPDIVASLKKIRAIGYQAVELLSMSTVTDAELKQIVAGEGLIACGIHESPDTIRKSPGMVADRLDQLGCKYVVCSHPPTAPSDFGNEDSAHQFIRALDRAGQALAERGKLLCYHNHGLEFVHLNGRPVMEILYEKTNPRHVQAELDTYWVQYGGGDPVEWCRRLAGRLPLLHMKDYGFSLEGKPTFAEIGNGNLRWPAILAAAEAAGCKWFIVEQDICPGNPFDSLQQSFDYIRTKLIK